MGPRRDSRKELIEEICYSVPGCFDIDFSKSFSIGRGKAKFYPFIEEDRFVNDSNYKDQICMMNSDLEEDDWINSDEIEADGYCVLTLEESPNREITFHEEIDISISVRGESLDHHYTEYSTEEDGKEVSDLIIRYIDLQCREALGKPLAELLKYTNHR